VITATHVVLPRWTKARFVGALASILLAVIGPVVFPVAAGGSTYPLINTLPTANDLTTITPNNSHTHVSVMPVTGTPTGSLALSGVLAVLAHNPALVSAFAHAHGGRGANVAYRFAFSGVGAYTTYYAAYTTYYAALAMKFPSATEAKYFAQQVTATLGAEANATEVPLATLTRFGSLKFGALPSNERTVLQLPSAPDDLPPGLQSAVSQMLFSDGTYYLLTTSGVGLLPAWSNMVVALRGCLGHSSNYYEDSLRCP